METLSQSVLPFAITKKTYVSQKNLIAQPVAQRHHMVNGSLALLLRCFEVTEGIRAAAPRRDKNVEWGKIL